MYDVEHPNPDETVLAVGSLLNVEQPRAYIAVQDAADRTASQVADELTAGFESGAFNIARTSTTIAGVEAIVLDRMPGQDINRVVVMVHGERLYTLTFAPADKSLGDVFSQLEELYTTAVRSFHLWPPSSAATAPAGEIAAAAATPSTAGSEVNSAPTLDTQWITYRDGRYGYGLAVPCQWDILPTPMEGNYATLTLRSYDDAYFMENLTKGMWREGQWPDGAIKMGTVF